MEWEKDMFPTGTCFLVTGAAGFIGSHLVETLLKMGCRVRGLDNFLTGKRSNIEPFVGSPLFELVDGDIRDEQTCSFACEGVDYVLHQAALGSVPRSVKDPLLSEEINIGGTLKMLNAARSRGVKRFVYASSSSVYGDNTKPSKVEGEEGSPLSPYAITKIVNELYARCYWHLYGVPTIGLRYFNVFGPRQDPDSEYAAVIPRFISALLNGGPVVIYGDGEQSRDFTYIDNVVQANLLACRAPVEVNGQAFNIACEESTTINQLLVALTGLLEKSVQPVHRPTRPGDVRHSLADISKASDCLGYQPTVKLMDGLKHTVLQYARREEHGPDC